MEKVWKTLTVTALAVVLFFSAFLAYKRAVARGQADYILGSAKEFAKALEYFYNDQNRYPSADEFASPQLLGRYLEGFPARQVTSGTCTTSFSYKRGSFTQYQLSFCLPASRGGYRKGWNVLEGRK